jgi:hypothetical protein
MKKLILVLTFMLFGVPLLIGQSTETGYVTVNWIDNCEDNCCTPLVFGACITIERVSDHEIILLNECAVESQGTYHTFEFDFPCSIESEEFMVYATVRKGCLDPQEECCFGRNEGEIATCGEFIGGEWGTEDIEVK